MTFDELALLACLHGDHIRYEDTEIEDENLEITDAEAEQADLVQATRDVAILDDLLILACGEHGLGLLKLSEEIFDLSRAKPTEAETEPDISLRLRGAGEPLKNNWSQCDISNSFLRVYWSPDFDGVNIISARAMELANAVLVTAVDKAGDHRSIMLERVILEGGSISIPQT